MIDAHGLDAERLPDQVGVAWLSSADGQVRLRAGLLGIGVLPQHKGTGLAQALAMRLYGRYEQKGLARALYYPVNESNLRSRRFVESLGGTGRMMYRVFDKVVGGDRPQAS